MKINVLNREVTLYSVQEDDFISLTDIARYKNEDRSDDLIRNWLRNRNTLEFLGIWERLNNPNFNPVEFDGIRMLAGLNSFTLTPKQWIKKTTAVGITSKAGRHGGTYAHKDIAFEFASLENLNAVFIADGLLQADRLSKLNEIAIHQMTILTSNQERSLPGGKKLNSTIA